jgi:putative spermidine/putrescine transport system substrate-binding protein
MDRRLFLKLMGAGAVMLGGSATLLGCADDKPAGQEQGALDYADWDAVVNAATDTTVTYAGYSGDDALNEWLTGIFTPALQAKYGITLKYAQDVDITTIISDQITAGAGDTSGSFDVGWVNGASFAGPQAIGGYFGPITNYLPNFSAYIDTESELTNYDFTYPIDGFECPFSCAEINFIKDDAVTPGDITTPDAFLAFAKQYPGKTTYITADHWLGAAVVRTFIYNIVGWEQFQGIAEDYDTIKAAIEPALVWLRDLNPYLWKEGTTFPADHNAIEQMFLTGEVAMVQTYGQYDCGFNIKKGIYTTTSKSYLFSKGVASNFSYWAIPFDSPNKAGALVVVNEMIDPAMQLEKARIGEGFVTDLTKVDSSMRTEFENLDLGPNNCTNEELVAAARPEYSAAVETIVAQIWLDEVVGKTN